jgi:hypothetical protein
MRRLNAADVTATIAAAKIGTVEFRVQTRFAMSLTRSRARGLGGLWRQIGCR